MRQTELRWGKYWFYATTVSLLTNSLIHITIKEIKQLVDKNKLLMFSPGISITASLLMKSKNIKDCGWWKSQHRQNMSEVKPTIKKCIQNKLKTFLIFYDVTSSEGYKTSTRPKTNFEIQKIHPSKYHPQRWGKQWTTEPTKER